MHTSITRMVFLSSQVGLGKPNITHGEVRKVEINLGRHQLMPNFNKEGTVHMQIAKRGKENKKGPYDVSKIKKIKREEILSSLSVIATFHGRHASMEDQTSIRFFYMPFFSIYVTLRRGSRGLLLNNKVAIKG